MRILHCKGNVLLPQTQPTSQETAHQGEQTVSEHTAEPHSSTKRQLKYIHEGHDWDCLCTEDIQHTQTVWGQLPQGYSEVVLLPWNWCSFICCPCRKVQVCSFWQLKSVIINSLLLDICFYSNLRTNLEFFSETTYSQAVLHQWIPLGLMPAGSISEVAGKKSHQRIIGHVAPITWAGNDGRA